jgi:ketosteroid isomerase-like protein
MSVELMQRYADAWNAHDIDAIMSMMTDDCVFVTGGGTEKHGTRFEGVDIVRARFIDVWSEFPDLRFENPRYFGDTERGCTEWTFVGTNADGVVTEVDGCDLFDFVGGKIRVKNSYIKIRR